MVNERTLFNILWNSLEVSATGNIIAAFYGLPDEGKGKLEIIAADLYELDDNLTNEWSVTVVSRDFCNPRRERSYPSEEERVERRFRAFLKDPASIDQDKYKFKRVLQFVVEGDDAVSRVLRLAGDIRERRGDTLQGKFGHYEIASDGKITGIRFPIYVPSSVEQAEEQIDLFWNKYKNLGGPNPRVLRKCPSYGQTVVLIKPHAFHAYEYDTRWGDIIDRFSRAHGVIIGAKVLKFTRDQLDVFYSTKVGESWYEPEFVPEMTGGTTLALLYEGPHIQQGIRNALLEVVRPAFGDRYDPSKTAAHASDPTETNCVEREKFAVNFEDNILPSK